jgi:hypothetical protein
MIKKSVSGRPKTLFFFEKIEYRLSCFIKKKQKATTTNL